MFCFDFVSLVWLFALVGMVVCVCRLADVCFWCSWWCSFGCVFVCCLRLVFDCGACECVWLGVAVFGCFLVVCEMLLICFGLLIWLLLWLVVS